jgi:L-arabinose isomerase
MEEVPGDTFAQAVRGWFTPGLPLNDFLAEYSRAGGTHHSALVYGVGADTLARLGEFMKWPVTILG